MNHGDPTTINQDVWMGTDPDLAMVTADPVVWELAHPCECDGLCVCEGDE